MYRQGRSDEAASDWQEIRRERIGATALRELADVFTAGEAAEFEVLPAFPPDSFAEFVPGVVPTLQRLKLSRHDYSATTLCGHLQS